MATLKASTNNTRNVMNGIGEERIILNVGGIKYETYRSTLTAFPTTLLGIMFHERNSALLHPTNGNEYFIDRDGHLFWYIIQFYRTGKIYWPDERSSSNNCATTLSLHHHHNQIPISRESLEDEMDYFQIPLIPRESDTISFTAASSIRSFSSLTPHPAVLKLDSFVAALREIIFELIAIFEKSIRITFQKNRGPPYFYFGQSTDHDAAISETVRDIINPFGSVGYTILGKFGTEIGLYLENEQPGLKWKYEDYANLNSRSVRMSLTDVMYGDDEVLKNSCLCRNGL
ncbi:3351_t:CDS:2 [Ambispora leptoticha]|uniref:3351_t:CDS:1 n=1 Tax=Ambispora leptoticha TaxID=144679 RepID=A0A9N9G2B7_9GLOM|nr:3351_t:CDS:2 [Ambispora leptoticha]